MLYSYFSNIKSRQCEQVSVDELINRLKSPFIKSVCDGILKALEEGNDEEASRLKAQLPVIVLGQLYENGSPRSKDGGKPTGALMIDYDDCKTIEDAKELMSHIKQKWLSDIMLQDLILAVHYSPRMHGVHVWYRWIDGCKSYAECNERIAQLIGRTDYDEACKDNSRCSFLVPFEYFEISNWDGLSNNEEFASLQSSQETNETFRKPSSDNIPLSNATSGASADISATHSFPLVYRGIDEKEVSYSEIIAQLVRKCAPTKLLDEQGNVMQGARDNTWFKVACLIRYLCDNDAEWVFTLAPQWAHDLGEARLRELCQNACKRSLAYSAPRTLQAVLDSYKDDAESEQARLEAQEEEANRFYVEQLEGIEESKRKFLIMPKKMPPIFQEYCDSVKPEWKAAVVCTLLPTLGTLMSKVRGKYLDGEMHSASFQTVIEAKMASGKSVYTRIARHILAPVIALDLEGNTKINIYNQEAVKANGSKSLGEMPDVCVRMMGGQFTEAGFNSVLDTSKGLHVWTGVSEIDSVADCWKSLSYILRLAYDNEQYQRTLQSIKQFRGSRPLYLNTFLCGTPHAVARVYRDPEDGLVSRTIFFKHMVETPGMPISKVKKPTLERIAKVCKTIHDKYCITDSYEVAMEQEKPLSYINNHINKWLDRKRKEAVVYGSEAIERFRRRDAVNGFRAGMVAHVVFEAWNKDGKLSQTDRKTVCEFAEWVAEYSLMMHDYKFGKELNRLLAEDELDAPITKTPFLDQLPEVFSLSEAYRKFQGQAPVYIRKLLSRCVQDKMLVREERGLYRKL